MFLLYDTGEPILDPDDYEETFQAAVKPLLEMEQMDQRSGPCEDDCQVTAVMIEDAVRYEANYLDPRSHAHIDRILTYYMQQGLYPEKLHNGPPGLPCGGILTNKV